MKNYIFLKPYNTLRINVLAKYFFFVNTIAELQKIIDFKHKNNTPIYIIGSGSNILLTKNIQGLLIKMNIGGISLVKKKKDMCTSK